MAITTEKAQTSREGKVERGARIYRNASLVGALALEGAATVMPPIAGLLSALAGLGLLHAGGSEIVRRSAKARS